MGAPPSIKATGFQSAADDLQRLVAAGRVSREQLAARLPERDFAYLDKALAASSWVPIETYVRVGAILLELEGRGDARAYFRARGVAAAARLHKAGLYKQFDASVETWGKRAGTLATTNSRAGASRRATIARASRSPSRMRASSRSICASSAKG